MDFKHVLDLKMTLKIHFGEKINFLNFTTVPEHKNPCSIQTQDLWVGRPKQHPLHHRDEQQILLV